MINDGRLLAIADSQKVLNIWPRRGDWHTISCFPSELKHALDVTKSNARGLQKRLLPKSLWTPLADIVGNHPNTILLFSIRGFIVTRFG
jgi:hypothetical protein